MRLGPSERGATHILEVKLGGEHNLKRVGLEISGDHGGDQRPVLRCFKEQVEMHPQQPPVHSPRLQGSSPSGPHWMLSTVVKVNPRPLGTYLGSQN